MILPWRKQEHKTRAEWIADDPRRLYSILETYYHNLDVYSDIQAALWERGVEEDIRAFRNPANRAVEFYAAKLWPGTLPEALPIETDNDSIIPAIHRVWRWSNWSAAKQVAARQMATLGDLFVKVSTNDAIDRVQFEVIHPEHVVEFDVDLRGFLEYARLDFPVIEREGDKAVEYTIVEVWDKERYRRWRKKGLADADTRRLGTPELEIILRTMGIDFVPIVHAKQRDVGHLRGQGAFTHALDKIDEANRQATRLAQMLFRHNKNVWALQANGTDASGRPLPAPTVNGISASTERLELEDESFIRLPGNSSLASLVPNLNYAAALAVLQDHMEELQRDLPELAYYQLREMNQVSGVAVRTLLSDAIDRLLEARGNAEAALVRANQMALTIGKFHELETFREVEGTFEDGAFEHAFKERDVIPLTATEESLAEQQDASTLVIKTQLGLSQREALRELGYTDEDIERMELERSQEQEARNLAAQRNFDAGNVDLEEL